MSGNVVSMVADRRATLQRDINRVEQRLATIASEQRDLRSKLTELSQEEAALRPQIGELKKELAAIDREPRITDHAVLRYLERFYGFNIEEVRSRLMTRNVVAGIQMGANAISIEGGKLMVTDNVVTTFIPSTAAMTKGRQSKRNRRSILREMEEE